MVGTSLLTALDKVSMVDMFHGGHVSWWTCFMVDMFLAQNSTQQLV